MSTFPGTSAGTSQSGTQQIPDSAASLKGRFVTFVGVITDPQAYASENPLNTHRLAGVRVVGLSAGDLMAYSERLEALAGGQESIAVRAAYERFCFPGRRSPVTANDQRK